MYAPTANTVFSPLDERWGVDNSLYSPTLKGQMVWLSGLLPYAQAEAVMQRIGHQTMSDSSLWRAVEHYAECLEQVPPGVADSVLPESTKAVSMDGGMVNIREEGWKEFKVGLVGTVCERLTVTPPESPVHMVNLAYTAVLGEVTAFAPCLAGLARAQEVFTTEHTAILGDGAAWIWGIAERDFPTSVQIVDWYHAGQHLAAAADALYPNDATQAATWRQTRSDDLFAGDVASILHDLEKAGLDDEQHFFQTHQARMQYATFRDAGYPIGSGSVESEVKQFKARLTGPGMRWSRPGVERMLLIRAAILDGSFDTRWALAA